MRTTVSPDELQSVLTAAEAARAGWRDTPLARRAEICESMVQHLESVADDIAVELAHQMGRPVRFGSVGGGGRYDDLVARYQVKRVGSCEGVESTFLRLARRRRCCIRWCRGW